VNAALADAFQKSSKWLACRPGCRSVAWALFAINQRTRFRLEKGSPKSKSRIRSAPARIRERVNANVARLFRIFPGDSCSYRDC